MTWGTTMSERIRSVDGRVRIATLTGVSALVAVLALLVGVLPVLGYHDASGVTPQVINEGGGSGKCSVETGDLPSVAQNEFHINNPTGTHESADGVIRIEVRETPDGSVFDLYVQSSEYVVYDVIVNGGPKSNHYDFDGDGETVGEGNSPAEALHAPSRGNGTLFNLSHINVCYDVPGLTSIPCDDDAIRITGQDRLLFADLVIFENSVWDCTEKTAQFVSEGDVVIVSFEGDGSDTIAGRLDFYKQFPSQVDVEPLEYNGPNEFVDLQWCALRDKETTSTGTDGDQFDDVLDPTDTLAATDTEYPSLVGVFDTLADDSSVQATACKVSEQLNAGWVQHTVVYFEFEDPQFR